MTQLRKPRSHLRGLTGMMIRTEIYKAFFPHTDPRTLDAMELHEIGALLGNDMGATSTEREQDELVELQRKRSERMRQAAERKRNGG